ncbi:MAG: YdeI/OmpD-associated family protein [Bacteroidota bacterium]
MVKTENFAQVEIASSEELREWLLANHEQAESVWLVTYKKSRPDKYVSRWDVLDELICFGWIDGVRRKLDERRTMQLISPRKVQHWAKSYKDRAAKLIAAGRMHEAGQRSIAESKASGLWNFMDDVDQLIVPDDLQNALDQQHGASNFFGQLNDSSKRFVLRWVKLAKTDKTRSNRIQKLVTLSAQGKKLPGS